MFFFLLTIICHKRFLYSNPHVIEWLFNVRFTVEDEIAVEDVLFLFFLDLWIIDDISGRDPAFLLKHFSRSQFAGNVQRKNTLNFLRFRSPTLPPTLCFQLGLPRVVGNRTKISFFYKVL